MKVEELEAIVKESTDVLGVKRVFGEPIKHDGLTVIPVARIGGFAVGGTGQGPEEQGKGSGGGLRVNGRALGTYVIKGDKVRFVPAVDVNRLFGTIGLVAAVLVVFVLGPLVRRR